jgi:hypothetical protein
MRYCNGRKHCPEHPAVELLLPGYERQQLDVISNAAFAAASRAELA